MSLDEVIIKGTSFPTLIAVTEDEHATGLMFRKDPCVMTFPYDRLAIRKFWMKNTLLPLDIVFCREGKVVDVCHGEPLSEMQIGPNMASDLVIELPCGTAKILQLKTGDAVELKYSTRTKLRRLSSNISNKY
jgi:uncharacterized membrane protein (UPF0127 family)